MKRIIVPAVLVFAATGCVETPRATGFGDTYRDDADVSYEAPAPHFQREVVDGTMAGNMPANGDFERGVTRGSMWSSDSTWIDLEIHATGDAWAMIVGSLDTSRLEEGVPVQLSRGEFEMVGCSGPAEYEYAFDGPADSVVVTEETVGIDGEQHLEYTVAVGFPDGDLSTTFVVPVPDEG